MKLNDDLIRDILFAVEESGAEPHDALTKFRALKSSTIPVDELTYHARLLNQAGYLDLSARLIDDGTYIITHIDQITWDGQQFLKNIRDEKVWSKAKKTASEKFSSVSINILSEIAAAIIKKTLLDV